MINTIFYFVDDETFDYNAALQQEAISPYTIVFNKFDKTIKMGGVSYGQMNRADIASVLSNISDILPVATDIAIGGIKLGYVAATNANTRTYAVQLDENNRAFVSVPWTDTITPQYDDTALRNLISEQGTRIDGYIQNLNTAIKERTEQLLDDAQWVATNVASGEVYNQYLDKTDEWGHQMGVWNWKDENDHTKGKVIKTSVLEQTVDGFESRIGYLETNSQTAGNVSGAITSALSDFSQHAGIELDANGVPTGNIQSVTTLQNSVSQYNTTNDGNIANLKRTVIAGLDLKAKTGTDPVTGEDIYQSITDLANAYMDNTAGHNIYSGLNQTVTAHGNQLSSQASLLSQVVQNDGTPNNTFKTNVTSGLITSSDAGTLADNKIASARTTLIADINSKSAGISVFATKDANGVIDTGITLKADQVTIDANQTNFKNAVASFVKTDVLQAGNATFSGHLSGVDGTFSGNLSAAGGTFAGTLSGATGQFSGDVTATKFLAGNPNGLNISMTDKAITFNVGGEARAWFTPFNVDGTSSDGMYLYIMNPDQTGSNKIVEIDFLHGVFIDATATAPVPTHIARFYRISGSSVQVVERYYKTESNVTTYYSDVECEHPVTDSLNLYEYSSVENNDKSYDYCIVKDTSENNNVYRFVGFERYRSISISNGVLTEGNTYKYFLLDSMYNNQGRLFLGNASQQTITTPNTNVMMAWSGMQMGNNGETGYTIESDATITPYCPQIADSYTSLSGTITLYSDYAGGTDDLYLGSYDYTIL